MNKELSIFFSHVRPFIRYVHKLPISHGEYPHFLRAYDNRLFYVSQGEATIHISISDNTYKLKSGDILLLKSNIAYDIDTIDGMELFGVNFDYLQSQRSKNNPIPPEKCTLFRTSELLESIHFRDAVCLNSPILLSNMYHLEDMLQQMLREYDAKMIYYSERLTSLFLGILVSIVREASTIHKYNVNTSHKVNKIITYIQNNYRDDITNNSIGKLFSYHPNYINKLMRLYTKKPLHQYLLEYRISKAIDLFYNTNEPVYEIALKVGFKDPCHFSKLFKQKMGLSPSAYRKLNHVSKMIRNDKGIK